MKIVTLFVTPNLSPNPNCTYNQSCLTFDDLMRSYLEIEGNFTLMFLKGYHTPARQLSLHKYTIYYSNWTIVGKSIEAIIYGTDLRFEFAGKLHIVNLTPTKGSFNYLNQHKLDYPQ